MHASVGNGMKIYMRITSNALSLSDVCVLAEMLLYSRMHNVSTTQHVLRRLNINKEKVHDALIVRGPNSEDISSIICST